MSTPEDQEQDSTPDPPPLADSSQDVSPAASPETGAAEGPEPRWTTTVPAAVLVLALLVGLSAAMAGFGSRWGLWNFRTGFTVLRWAAYGGVAATLLAIPAIWVTRPGQGRRRGLLFAAPVFIIPMMWRARAGAVPPIHDITTDTNNPPQFEAIAPLRADAPNPVDYPGPEVAAQQLAAYPDIRPAVLDLPQERAFERALAAATAMGWEIVAVDAEDGRIEATDRTFWFGFRDDVVIRLTPSGERTIVDARSKSRVRDSDVGTNARRIRAYLERLAA
jgi:uncharacterized protein (DUF1499 family)